MRSLSARGFSFLKLRRLSATHVDGKTKHELLIIEENSSDPRPSNTEQHPSEEYGSNNFGVANRELVVNHFDQDYLENRSNLLAYGKQMKRVEGTLELPPVARAQEIESRSSKVVGRKSNKPCRQYSWLSKVKRRPGRDQAGSKSQNRLLSLRA